MAARTFRGVVLLVLTSGARAIDTQVATNKLLVMQQSCADQGPWWCSSCVTHGARGFEVSCSTLSGNGQMAPDLFCSQMLMILFAGLGTTTLPSGLAPTARLEDICPVTCGACQPTSDASPPPLASPPLASPPLASSPPAPPSPSSRWVLAVEDASCESVPPLRARAPSHQPEGCATYHAGRGFGSRWFWQHGVRRGGPHVRRGRDACRHRPDEHTPAGGQQVVTAVVTAVNM